MKVPPVASPYAITNLLRTMDARVEHLLRGISVGRDDIYVRADARLAMAEIEDEDEFEDDCD
jgi:hypothetical protein